MAGKLKKGNKNILGHTHTFTGYAGGTPYLTATRGAVDGIGRHHVNLYGRCDICDKEILVAKIHADAKTDKLFFKK